MTLPLFRLTWLILSAVSYCLLTYTVPRQQFDVLVVLLTGLFLGYWLILRRPALPVDRQLFGAAVFFRLLLLAATPQLSDDVYRFIWDGRLLTHGFNPYLYLPRTTLNTHVAVVSGLNESLFRQLNSPGYFTVYPPLNQALFGLAAWLSGGEVVWTIVWLRIPILFSEIGTLWLLTKILRHQHLNPNVALLYGLNPLVILELTGNIHFEAVMIFFVLLSVWWLLQQRIWLSAGAFSLAIGTKLLPVLLLPLAIRRLGWKKGLAVASLTIGLTIAQFLPFASLDLIQNIVSSINLYFQKFEFNASLYYVLREIGFWIRGYNTIGILGLALSITTTLSILWISFRWRRVSAAVQVLASLTIYFGFATTVHPWYITTLIAAAVFTRFRYPLVWSALIPLSYFTYRTVPYQENLWLTGVEYGLTGVFALLELGLYRVQTDKSIDRPTNGLVMKQPD